MVQHGARWRKMVQDSARGCKISESLVTADGAYHCPVGSIWLFLELSGNGRIPFTRDHLVDWHEAAEAWENGNIYFFAMSRWVVFTRQKVTLPWHMVETRPWIKILSLIFSLFFEASEQRLCKIDHRKCICRPKQQWSRDIVEMHTTNKEIVPFGVTATM